MLKKVKEVIGLAGDRESFFKKVASIYPVLDHRYKIIERAYNDAKDAFRGKKRKGGERYFEHLRAVALIVMLYLRVKDYRLIAAALLHDIVEDIDFWKIERVQIEYGSEIAALVEWATKPYHLFSEKAECHRVYHCRFARAPRDFFIIKLSDRLHNLLTMWSVEPENRAFKIQETKTFYLPYAEKEIILIQELEAALAELEKA